MRAEPYAWFQGIFLKKISLVTTCSARKMRGTTTRVRARDVSPGSLESVLMSWRMMLEAQTELVPIERLYSGRAIREMKNIAQRHGASLHIVSAGLGLIGIDDSKPSYDLTVSGNGCDSVVSKIELGNFSATSWWTGINNGEQGPIANLIRQHENTLFVIALSAPYYEMVHDDLESLNAAGRESIRIVGIKQQPDSPLARSILPYDDRFNGPDSPVPGTLSDYPQRCAVHYVDHVYKSMSLEDDRMAVAEIMETMSWPVRKSGVRLSDAELLDVIGSELERSGMSKTKMLRHFRNTLKIACEQKRFSRLYVMAVTKKNA